MRGYKYHSNTHEYLGEVELKLDKYATSVLGEDVYFIPSDVTTTRVPEEKEDGYTYVFDRIKNQWTKVIDNRGRVYEVPTGSKFRPDTAIIRQIGEKLPEQKIPLSVQDFNEKLAYKKEIYLSFVNTWATNGILEASKYSNQEAASFPTQLKEAMVLKEDNRTVSTPLLDSISKARGTTREALADKIITKHNQLLEVQSKYLGTLGRVRGKIKKATTDEELYSAARGEGVATNEEIDNWVLIIQQQVDEVPDSVVQQLVPDEPADFNPYLRR